MRLIHPNQETTEDLLAFMRDVLNVCQIEAGAHADECDGAWLISIRLSKLLEVVAVLADRHRYRFDGDVTCMPPNLKRGILDHDKR